MVGRGPLDPQEILPPHLVLLADRGVSIRERTSVQALDADMNQRRVVGVRLAKAAGVKGETLTADLGIGQSCAFTCSALNQDVMSGAPQLCDRGWTSPPLYW